MTESLASLLSNCVEFSVQGSHVSQHGKIVIVSHNGGDSGHCSRALTEQRTSLGIMVFSSTCRVLYANQAAYHFLKVLNRLENGHATDGALPASIAHLFDEMLKSLESRITNRDQKPLEARRLLVGQDQPVLLQVFELPDRLGLQQSRVVITMEEITHSLEAAPCEAFPPSA